MGSPKKRIGERSWVESLKNDEERLDIKYYALYWFKYQFQVDDGVNKRFFLDKNPKQAFEAARRAFDDIVESAKSHNDPNSEYDIEVPCCIVEVDNLKGYRFMPNCSYLPEHYWFKKCVQEAR